MNAPPSEDTALVRSGPSGLTSQRQELVRPGLELLRKRRARVLCFPENWNVANLRVHQGVFEIFEAPEPSPGPTYRFLEFVLLGPARGVMRVPEGVLLYLELLSDAGDANLVPLSGLQADALDIVGMERTKVTDAGLAHLAALRELRGLTLSHTKVTHAGLAQLAGLRKLRSVDLGGTKNPFGAGRELGRWLPGCHVWR